jgi:hypothetical protein
MDLFVRLVIIVSVVIALTDIAVFYHVMRTPEIVTWQFVAAVIVITIIPIAINLWYWLVFRQPS